MGKLKSILLIIVLAGGIAQAKITKTYDAQKRVKEVVVENEEADMECLREDRPYIVLSKWDKKRLEQIIRGLEDKKIDPNMAMP